MLKQRSEEERPSSTRMLERSLLQSRTKTHAHTHVLTFFYVSFLLSLLLCFFIVIVHTYHWLQHLPSPTPRDSPSWLSRNLIIIPTARTPGCAVLFFLFMLSLILRAGNADRNTHTHNMVRGNSFQKSSVERVFVSQHLAQEIFMSLN